MSPRISTPPRAPMIATLMDSHACTLPDSSKLPDSTPRRFALLLAASVLTTVSVAANAFDMNSNAPISVSAASARLDDKAGRATYTGNVIVTQAGSELYADRVELYRDENGLSRILAYGEPARYEQAETIEDSALDARADEITFDAIASILLFRENAVIHQAGDVFRGDTIRYDTEERIVTAEGGQSSEDGRVEMVIQPRRGNGTTSGQGGGDGASQGE